MLIDYNSNEKAWTVRCSFNERDAFRNAGWAWDGTVRKWATRDASLARQFEPFMTPGATEALNGVDSAVLSALELSYASDYPITVPAPPGCSYDPHQRAAIYYASIRKDTLCADPPGLGKTVIAAGLSNLLPEVSRVLIVCPAHLKVNWRREWEKWCVKGLSVGIARAVTKRERVLDVNGKSEKDPITGKTRYRYWTEHDWPDTDVVICNYDMLTVFSDKIRSMLWDLLIVDEAHYISSLKSMRTRQVLGAWRQKKKTIVDGKKVTRLIPAVDPIPADRRLFLTGTPIMSRPIDLWPIVLSCDPKGLGKNWISFTRRYCNGHKCFGRYDTSGSSNLEELQIKLRLGIMIRRDKETVMKDLPSKRRQLIELPSEGLVKLIDDESAAVYKVRDALAQFEADQKGLDPVGKDTSEIEWTSLAEALERRFGHLSNLDYLDRVKHLTPPETLAFEELSTARKALSAAKIPMVVEHLENLLASGEKIVVFTVHTEMAEKLRAHFPQAAYVTGKVPSDKRQAQVDLFQNDVVCNLFIGNMRAAGTGYTLTASNIVVCAELDWVQAVVEQAEDRVWRRGQKNAVLAQHLVVEGSSDARLVEVLLQKASIYRRALDIDALGDETERKRLISAL